jgi:precorrin-6B methylase 2
MTGKIFNHEILQGFLAQLYQEATGYLRYSPEEVKNYFNQAVCLTYGEVEYLSLIAFAQKIHLGPNDVFLDLGSGLGKICASILLGTPCKEAIGIEAALGLHEQAIKVLPKLNVFLEPEDKKITLCQGNFLSPQFLPHIQRATVVFINSTAFTCELLDKIGLMLNHCPFIRAIFSFKPFANLNLPFSQSISIEASWDTVLGRLYASKTIPN